MPFRWRDDDDDSEQTQDKGEPGNEASEQEYQEMSEVSVWLQLSNRVTPLAQGKPRAR